MVPITGVPRRSQAIVTGTTTGFLDDVTPGCGAAGGLDRVYQLTLFVPGDLSANVMTTGGGATVSVLDAACTGEVACALTTATSRSLLAGTYFIVVDTAQAATFTLTVTLDLLQPGDTCETAYSSWLETCTPPNLGANPGCFNVYLKYTGDLSGFRQDQPQGACGMPGADRYFEVDLLGRSAFSAQVTGLVSVVQVSGPSTTETCRTAAPLGCGSGTTATVYTPQLDAGTYRVTVGAYGQSASDAGFNLVITRSRYEGDLCIGPVPIGLDGGVGHVVGSSFGYFDDVASSCGSAGSPDTFHSVTVAQGQSLEATLRARATLFSWRGGLALRAPGQCGAGADFACAVESFSGGGATVQSGPLDAGVYVIEVLGTGPGESGVYELDVVTR